MPPKRTRSSSRGRPAAKAAPLAVSEDEEPTPVSKRTSKGRSRSQTPSRGKKTDSRKKSASRSAAKSPARAKTAASAKKKKVYQMKHAEDEDVMARWPGTNLYFKGKVTLVRDDDNEYDVRFEDGSEFTLKAKDVKADNYLEPRARSRSRGRAAKDTKTVVTKKVSPAKSLRSRLDTSADSQKSQKSNERSKAKEEKETDSGHRLRIVDVLVALVFLSVAPLKLICLQLLCKPRACRLAWPVFPKRLDAYWNQQSFLATLFFLLCVRVISYVPLGKTIIGRHGKPIRINGFFIGLAALALLPAFVLRKVNLEFLNDHFFHLMISSLILAILSSVVLFFSASWVGTQQNPKGSTGNLVVDFFHGRQINAYVFGLDVKVLFLRASMIALAFINGCLLTSHIFPADKDFTRQQVNPALMLNCLFQIIYAMDQLFFEEYYRFSYDGETSGLGFAYVTSYMTFPFVSTLVTRYLMYKTPTSSLPELLALAMIFTLGYVMYRSSENQRCEFLKDPVGPAVRQLEVLTGRGGRRIICSGWWSFVRFPNYLGEIIIFWSWVLPAVSTAGAEDVLIYYVPLMSTFIILLRLQETIERKKKELGETWKTYCQKVEANLIPYVY